MVSPFAVNQFAGAVIPFAIIGHIIKSLPFSSGGRLERILLEEMRSCSSLFWAPFRAPLPRIISNSETINYLIYNT
jgi:hypothetical protein